MGPRNDDNNAVINDPSSDQVTSLPIVECEPFCKNVNLGSLSIPSSMDLVYLRWSEHERTP